MGAFIGVLECLDYPLGEIMNQLELDARLTVMSRWKLLEEPAQPCSGCAYDQDVAEAIRGAKSILERVLLVAVRDGGQTAQINDRGDGAEVIRSVLSSDPMEWFDRVKTGTP